MNWYYKILGGHTHVRVFMNGGKCGDLCFRNEEFDQIRGAAVHDHITCGHVVTKLINENDDKDAQRACAATGA